LTCPLDTGDCSG